MNATKVPGTLTPRLQNAVHAMSPALTPALPPASLASLPLAWRAANEMDLALDVYRQMLNEGCTPNLVT